MIYLLIISQDWSGIWRSFKQAKLNGHFVKLYTITKQKYVTNVKHFFDVSKWNIRLCIQMNGKNEFSLAFNAGIREFYFKESALKCHLLRFPILPLGCFPKESFEWILSPIFGQGKKEPPYLIWIHYHG